MYDRRCVARLGDILVKLGLCTPEQVQSALAAQVLYGWTPQPALHLLSPARIATLADAGSERSHESIPLT